MSSLASTESAPAMNAARKVSTGLVVAAVGVVLGDIGTSPLYAFKEIFIGGYGVAVSPDSIRGVLSLLLWSMIWVVSIKYVMLVTRADNQGEGGVLSLMALARRYVKPGTRRRGLLVTLGLLGAALLYGDSMITPAVSVLSSIEGLELAYPHLDDKVVPISVVIILGLFTLQRFGTERIGKLFGPVMLLWFLTLGVLGLINILKAPAVLEAVNPWWALTFFHHNPGVGITVFSAVTLVLTGAEALYADLGHFGRPAIIRAWTWVAMPALILNYFGQGALLTINGDALRNPFFLMAPDWLLLPLVILASMATVIASQAVITAAFSLTQQAVRLGYLPRLRIRHTSNHAMSQIYMPAVNWTVMVGVLLLITLFQSSARLAAAYGVAVTGTMVITSCLMVLIVLKHWRWPIWCGLPLVLAFLVVDVALFYANLTKFFHGGAVPVVIAIVVFITMDTWRRGRMRLERAQQDGEPSMDELIHALKQHPPARIKGCAIYLCGRFNGTPSALRQNLEFNKVLHEQVLLLTVITDEVPHVPADRRCEARYLGSGVSRLVLHFGFMECTDVPLALKECHSCVAGIDPDKASWFVGREVPLCQNGILHWQQWLFQLMFRNARSPARAFNLPSGRVVEIGGQVML
ncbi:potassium transporter Kup [Zymobacter sp. IVIA_12111.31 C1]|uniref:potassium transporter Kup n=1 Tax=Zymobacter sp. IVIA_12111.31 C1 TaxID=3394854 RepID=UPI0039C1B1D2